MRWHVNLPEMKREQMNLYEIWNKFAIIRVIFSFLANDIADSPSPNSKSTSFVKLAASVGEVCQLIKFICGMF